MPRPERQATPTPSWRSRHSARARTSCCSSLARRRWRAGRWTLALALRSSGGWRPARFVGKRRVGNRGLRGFANGRTMCSHWWLGTGWRAQVCVARHPCSVGEGSQGRNRLVPVRMSRTRHADLPRGRGHHRHQHRGERGRRHRDHDRAVRPRQVGGLAGPRSILAAAKERARRGGASRQPVRAWERGGRHRALRRGPVGRGGRRTQPVVTRRGPRSATAALAGARAGGGGSPRWPGLAARVGRGHGCAGARGECRVRCDAERSGRRRLRPRLECHACISRPRNGAVQGARGRDGHLRGHPRCLPGTRCGVAAAATSVSIGVRRGLGLGLQIPASVAWRNAAGNGCREWLQLGTALVGPLPEDLTSAVLHGEEVGGVLPTLSQPPLVPTHAGHRGTWAAPRRPAPSTLQMRCRASRRASRCEKMVRIWRGVELGSTPCSD